jgi:hypothetical protein
MADRLAQEQVARYAELKAERDSLWLSGWQEISNYFMPSQSAINTQKLPGTTTGWTDRIYDTTAIHAAQVLSAGQRNWLTPSNEPWFAYEPPEFLNTEDRSDDKDEVATWLANASEVTARELARSNFYGQVNIDYDQVGTFGTGMMFAEQGKRTALNFRQFKPWFLTIEEDDEGIVDSVHREFELTTRQAVQQFGLAKVGDKIAKAYNSQGADQLSKKWKFLHACFPREDSKRLTGRMDGENKPIASVYIAYDDKVTVEVGGYDEMPYLCSRFKSWGAPTCWGYSPAYLVLTDARQINFVSQYRDALSELKAYPRILYPDNLEGDVDLSAGGVTTYDSSNPEAIPKEWMTEGDDRSAEETMVRRENAINRAFYVNMFTMLEQLADKKMTAYEIAQRLGEKLEQFTPVFDRRVTEFLNPLLTRVFGILFRQGKFGTPPQALMVPVDGGRALEMAMPVIAITSRISLALKALQNQAIVNTLSILQPLAQVQPEVLDNFDMDKMSRQLGRNYGMSADLLRPERKVKEFRDARQKAAAAQQAADLAEKMGGTMADLGKAPKPVQDAVIQQFAPTG